MNKINRAKILYTDDSPELLHLYKEALTPYFEVVTNEDPRSVIRLIKEEKPQAVLLDVDMPTLNGFDIYEKIQETFQTQDIPSILFLSSFDDDQTVTSCFEIGADDFISKSTSIPQIAARIHSKIGRRKTADNNLKIAKDVSLDIHKKIIYSKDFKIQLTPHEYRLLYFTSQKTEPIDKSELITKVWGETVVLEKTINTHLTNLRKKLRLVNFSINIQKNGMVILEPIEQATSLFSLKRFTS